MRVLGLDIGGVHIKYALANKKSHLPKPQKIPFEIFRDPEKLITILKKIRGEVNPDAIALTMTGELSDIFASRKEGVRFIINCVTGVFKRLPVKVLDIDGNFISTSKAIKQWERVASANWMATARWVASHKDNCIVVDIGSTTTDIIPIKSGKVAAIGKNDFDRLKTGELLYMGYLRTNSAMVCSEIRLDGVMVKACPEYFSIVGDAHLYQGDITAKYYTCPTPDGGPKTKRGAAIRLARLVLSDPKTLGEAGVESIAKQISEALIESIAQSIDGYINRNGLDASPILLIGPGMFYKSALAKILQSYFIEQVDGISSQWIDPASCIADLFLLSIE